LILSKIADPTLAHPVLQSPIGKIPESGEAEAIFALGCFWGAERKFWGLPGVVSTAVGYIAGHQDEPDYHAVCSGVTGHTEAVRVVFREDKTSYLELLRCFWEAHNPTQGNRQGNDIGSQYRSGIYVTSDDQMSEATASREAYQKAVSAAGGPAITTEIIAATTFWYAEEYHQQYLHKNPNGYCGLGGCGVKFPG